MVDVAANGKDDYVARQKQPLPQSLVSCLKMDYPRHRLYVTRLGYVAD